jgi:rSAM/selenodomain-associated transferase 2
MTISVIIPVLHEQERINGLIDHLRTQDANCEIIVVDGDPAASTLSVIIDPGTILLRAPKGRGNQLAAGASIATGDIILMLHADTLLPGNAFQTIQTAVALGANWGAFRLGINAAGILFRIIEFIVTLRCKLLTLPYGDQAIFVTRTALQKIGGIPAIPLMEDVELARRLCRTSQMFSLLPERVSTSARRWQTDGIVRRTLGNWWLLLRYLCGTHPEHLSDSYQKN